MENGVLEVSHLHLECSLSRLSIQAHGLSVGSVDILVCAELYFPAA